MSIPPLVCSTPPPPDQCEDEKLPDDFGIGYRLSQDDEEQSEYESNGFCNCNTFQSIPNSFTQDFNMPLPKIINNDKIPNNENEFGDDVINSKPSIPNEKIEKLDEDNVEDLDLQFEEVPSVNDKESPKGSVKRTQDSDSSFIDMSTDIETTRSSPTYSYDHSSELIDINKTRKEDINQNHDLKDKEIYNIQQIVLNEVTHEDIQNDISIHNNIQSALTKIDTEFSHENEDFQSTVREFAENSHSAPNVVDPQTVDTCIKIDLQLENELSRNLELPIIDHNSNDKEIVVNCDDSDFGDFNDFQYTNINDTHDGEKIVNCTESSPWSNINVENIDFKANFDNSESNTFVENVNFENAEVSVNECKENVVSDDDFDDFKSSTNNCPNHNQIHESDDRKNADFDDQLSVLDIQPSYNDAQVIEITEKVLSSVFENEIVEVTSDKTERLLETLLCETWAHLTDADIRQPYMINWNNSLAQKTLLKSLCIDSRNILFGPKWNNSMPKYAANLRASPLQPQKQNSTSATDTTNAATSRPTDNWVEPFHTEDQESCNSDNGNATSLGHPSEPNEFAQKTLKSDKIYPTTLNIQPMRQISLPDTHIYTPTDSEIPRSKTIHYDSGPSILIPQSLNNKNNYEITKSTNNDEFSDFQDFQCGTNTLTHTNNPQPSGTRGQNCSAIKLPLQIIKPTDIPFETQVVLQPVKVEPSGPTLNWPDPGEVKDTFDDFSDFVTSSTWNNDRDSIAHPKNSSESGSFNKSNATFTKLSQGNSCIDAEISSTNSLDDDFDTFQSAVPMSQNIHTFQTLSTDVMENQKPVSNYSLQIFPENLTTSSSNSVEFANFVSNTTVKSQDYKILGDHCQIKTPDQLVTKDSMIHNQFNGVLSVPIRKSAMIPNQMNDNKILQPTPANITQSKQVAGQILQPLSLESYSQINWPSPGVSLQDFSAFNPVKTLHTMKAEATSGHSKGSSPSHNQKSEIDDDCWGEFVSIKPKSNQPPKGQIFSDDDEWSDFVSSPNVNPHSSLNTISLNVHTNRNLQKSISNSKHKPENNQIEIPALNYITPKSDNNRSYSDRHFQNL